VISKCGVALVGQIGWLAKGFVYILAGVLALIVAGRAFSRTLVPKPSNEASPTGAIMEVRGMTGGRPLLVALAVGLSFYCLWRVLTAVLPGDTDLEAIVMRAGYLVSAVIYATFAITAVSLARHPALAVDGNRKVRDITAQVLHRPFGRVLIGLAGVVAVGAGVFRLVKALRSDIDDELTLYGLPPARLRWTQRFAVVGEVGRGIAVVLIGFFLFRSAWKAKVSEATGLDGALKRMSANALGRFLVVAVGVGFLLYGIMCLATVTRRKLPLNESTP
jgi:hypothetical protein